MSCKVHFPFPLALLTCYHYITWSVPLQYKLYKYSEQLKYLQAITFIFKRLNEIIYPLFEFNLLLLNILHISIIHILLKRMHGGLSTNLSLKGGHIFEKFFIDKNSVYSFWDTLAVLWRTTY